MNLPSLPRTQNTFKSDFWPTVIKYRAFTAGQQTLLLQVSDPSTPESQRADAMAQLFDQCVDAGVPFRSIPIGVMEEVFIRMRSISIGEIMKIKYLCKKEIEEEVAADDGAGETFKRTVACNQEIVLPIPLKDVKCVKQEGFTEVFDLPGNYHLKMRQPAFSDSTSLNGATSIEEMIATFIDCIYDDDGQVWKIEDPEEPGIAPELAAERQRVKQEFVKWVGDNIESQVISDISQNFFHKIPRVAYKGAITCPKCGGKHEITFNGINEIFI